jgi:lysozyme
MWQYTDGGVGPEPHSVNGIGSCDREYYKGTDTQLKSWWGK